MEYNPNLKIHIEEDETQVSLDSRLHDVLPVAKVLAQQFAAMTGWVLDYTPSEKAKKSFAPDSNLPIFGQFETVDMAPNVPVNQSALHRGQCDQLLDSINCLLRRLEAAELTLWQHQHYSEDVNHAFQDFQFPSNDSDVLAGLLRQASKAMNATGAALYLLDDDTTQLNLRATIGPASAARQMQTNRPLEHALADLEALVGSIVTITDPLIGESWKIPEPYQFGICVMLGEPSMPMGTVWFFFETAREANPQEMKLLEDLCEKIGTELQSRGKGRQPLVSSPLEQELQLTSKLNDCRLPSYPPEIDGWKISGWTYRQEPLAGVFHEWAVTPSGQLSIAVGQVAGPMLPATINANNLRSLICAHREYRHSANSMVAKLNENIWNNSPGDALASLIYVLVDPETNLLQAVNAGDGGMVYGNQNGVQSIDQFQNPLGADLDLPFEQWQCDVDEDDTLVLFSQGLRNALSETMNAINDAELLAEIITQNSGDAEAILQAIEDKFFASDFQHVAGDLSVVVLTRNSYPDAMSLAASEELRSIENEFANGDVDLLSALEDEIAALERLGFVRPNRNVIEPGAIEIEAEELYGDDDPSISSESDPDAHDERTVDPTPAIDRNDHDGRADRDSEGSDDHVDASHPPTPDPIDVDIIDESQPIEETAEQEASANRRKKSRRQTTAKSADRPKNRRNPKSAVANSKTKVKAKVKKRKTAKKAAASERPAQSTAASTKEATSAKKASASTGTKSASRTKTKKSTTKKVAPTQPSTGRAKKKTSPETVAKSATSKKSSKRTRRRTTAATVKSGQSKSANVSAVRKPTATKKSTQGRVPSKASQSTSAGPTVKRAAKKTSKSHAKSKAKTKTPAKKVPTKRKPAVTKLTAKSKPRTNTKGRKKN